MAMTEKDLDFINGPGSADALAAARERNRKLSEQREAAIRSGLGKVASTEGVVDPDQSLKIHTGELPVIKD